MSLPEVSPSEAARDVDAQLFEIERQIDWLRRVSPLDNAARWEAFQRSGYTQAEPLTYPPFDLDVDDVRAGLNLNPPIGFLSEPSDGCSVLVGPPVRC